MGWLLPGLYINTGDYCTAGVFVRAEEGACQMSCRNQGQLTAQKGRSQDRGDLERPGQGSFSGFQGRAYGCATLSCSASSFVGGPVSVVSGEGRADQNVRLRGVSVVG